MIFKQFFTPELAIYSYLIGDSGQAVLVDPTREVVPYIEEAREAGLEIVAILETHVHADFVSGSKELKNALQGKPLIYASKMGGAAWTPRYVDCPVADGDEVHFGSLNLRAKYTPGHTPEHLIWVCKAPEFVLTGDLLFAGGVGRPDLLGGETLEKQSKQLYETLFKTIKELPDAAEIYPGHGAGSLCGKAMSDRSMSTLGEERQSNPSLKLLPEGAWVNELLHQMPAAPLHFQRIKRINVEGPALLSERQGALSEVKSLTSDAFIIDMRDPLKFAAGHLERAVNIPFGAAFCNWAAMIVPENRPLIFVVPQADMAKKSERLLLLIGYDEIAGYMIAGDASSTLKLLTPHQLGKGELLIDVRTPSEWDSGHIEGAHHIEMARLPAVYKELPRDQPLALICGSGYRSSVAASWLVQAGFANVATVWGGMQAWRQTGLPIIQ